MKHMTREDAAVQRLLDRVRTIAVVGASPRPERHSHQACAYLRAVGYDVIPIRPDREDVAGLPSYASLADVPGPIDLVIVFRHREAAPAHVREAAAKRPLAIWLQPGVASPAAEAAVPEEVMLVKDRCILEDHRHGRQDAGHPRHGF